MSNRHDGVGGRQRIIRQHYLPDILRAQSVLAGEVEHRTRRVRRNHAMPGADEVPSQQAASASEFEHEALTLEHGFEQRQNTRGTRVGVETETEMMHKCE